MTAMRINRAAIDWQSVAGDIAMTIASALGGTYAAAKWPGAAGDALIVVAATFVFWSVWSVAWEIAKPESLQRKAKAKRWATQLAEADNDWHRLYAENKAIEADLFSVSARVSRLADFLSDVTDAADLDEAKRFAFDALAEHERAEDELEARNAALTAATCTDA